MFQLFGSPRFWLPGNTTWDDVFNKPGVDYPQPRELLYAIPLSIAALLLRQILVTLVFKPIARYFKVSTAAPRKAPPCDVLERIYLEKGRRAKKMNLSPISKQLGVSEDVIKDWVKARFAQDDICDFDKFPADCWTMLFHLFANIVAICGIMKRSWFWNLDECWIDHPYHSMTDDLWWYCMTYLVFNIVDGLVLVYQPYERRFLRLFLAHHVVSVFLICFGWVSNTARMGSVSLFVLENPGLFAFGAKVCENAKLRIITFAFFTCTVTSWISMRIIIYPIWVLYSIVFRRHYFIGLAPAHVVLEIMMGIITLMSFYWTILIFLKSRKALKTGNYFNDGVNMDELEKSFKNANGLIKKVN